MQLVAAPERISLAKRLPQLLAAGVVVIASVGTWLTFAAWTWIVDPIAAGGYELWLGGVPVARVRQGLVYLVVSGFLITLFAIVALLRLRVAGTWRFRAYSVARVLKWALFGLPFGYALSLITTTALFAETQVVAAPLEPFPWLAVGWALLVFVSIIVSSILLVLDVGTRSNATA